jgi:hypothetical protein
MPKGKNPPSPQAVVLQIVPLVGEVLLIGNFKNNENEVFIMIIKSP